MNLLDYQLPKQEPREPKLRREFPKAYGLLGGLMGTPPDEFQTYGSVLDSDAASRNAAVRQGAELSYLPSQSVNALYPLGNAGLLGMATKASGFNKVAGMLDAMRTGYNSTGEIPKLPLVPVAVLSAEEKAAYNANRTGNEPLLQSPVLMWRGKHQFKSRASDPPTGNAYPNNELLEQLDAVTSQELAPALDNLGRPSLQAQTPRTNYLGQLIRDNMVINVNDKGKGEIFSIIPEGDGLKKGQKAPAKP